MVDVPYTYKNQEYTDTVNVSKESLNYFNMPDKLMSLYDENKRAFIVKGTEEFEVRLPTVGISSRIQDYIIDRVQSKKSVDEFFAKTASFIFSDYINFTDTEYFRNETDSKSWTIEDISALDRISKFLSEGASQGFKHKAENGGEELMVPLIFRGGVKSIFIISDILGDFR